MSAAIQLSAPIPPGAVEHSGDRRFLIEIYAIERDVPFYGYGSTTFRRQAKEQGLEPDECYCLGGKLRDFPDIAIEVVLTSGGIAKLPIYAGLGVAEVWFWET